VKVFFQFSLKVGFWGPNLILDNSGTVGPFQLPLTLFD